MFAIALAAGVTGCGSGAAREPTTRELALERAQFVRVSEGLHAVQGAVARELAAARRAYPALASGLPRAPTPSLRAEVAAAGATAEALSEPRFMTEAARLTGPAAGIAGLYEDYARLAERGWRLTRAALDTVASGSPSQASFARENSSLYIDSIYDGHFDLSLLGHSLTSGYQRLGGASAFGARLGEAQVRALSAAYSIPSVRLEPHPTGAALGG